ncbi:MAG: pyridine nucleotide-disulfide oxidoreductase [Proteobacteria bacterium]|nr:MAG: pyridine nucleotide-disulfide oxidoreductase [Pseudomonadota bacterium]
MNEAFGGMNRRRFLTLAAGGVAGLALGLPQAHAAKVKTKARIVIVGAGAAGLALANRLANRLDGATITLVDQRKHHYYQPGFTLVAGGLKAQNYPISTTAEWLPKEATWLAEAAVEIDPEAKKVVTASGKTLPYDYLLVATGLQLDYAAIEGMSLDLIGTNGIGSLYAGPEYAYKTWQLMDKFTDTGGVGLFFRPATEMKCAGAPLKYTFITDDYARRKGTRDKIAIHYRAHGNNLFSVPIVHEKVRMLFNERGVDTQYHRVLTAIDPGKRIATFKTPEGTQEESFDFTNVIPPMHAPDVVMNSPLPWQTGKWAKEGSAEVDKQTLRHVRYPEIFAVGDIAGVPKGKTAASVKWQVPVAVDHLVADINGSQSDEIYNGYTSCPMITRIGRAMLVEFDYNNNLTPSFPGIIAPLEELWVSWLMKEIALKPTYYAMVRGDA